MLAPGTVLQGRYRIVRLLAQGGMGAVYLATDQRLGSTTALKETFFTDENLRRAFEREARLLANLRHPALVRVSDHFSEGEGQFLVMDYISGEDLLQLLERRGRAFDTGDVLEWADQLLAALEYLHSRQLPVIHRDIKPQNIKLTDEGQVILLDFGLAKGAAWHMSHMITSSSIFGYTPSYAPIEQIKGAGTDARSDLYSLGATLYHLITAAPPVDALTRVTEMAQGQPDPLRSIAELNEQVPPAVADVIKRAMMISRERRPASAADMRKALSYARQSPASARADDSTITAEPLPAEELSSQNPVAESKSAALPEDFIASDPSIKVKNRPVVWQGVRQTSRGVTTHALTKLRTSKRWKWGATIGAILLATVLAIVIIPPDPPQPPASMTPAQLKSFEFETVTVNANGAVKERRKGQARYYAEELGEGVALEMVEVPGGTFMMGTPDSQGGKDSDEGPQHQVTVPGFYIGKYEVTQAQWRAVARLPKVSQDLNPDPSYFKGDNLPVETVSWEDAVEFCDRLSDATGRAYRLPTEAEWEYVCRAGTTTPFAFGETITPDLVNYDGNSPYESAPKGANREKSTTVGSLGVANAFGLYDMHGNVWEWCMDNWHDSYRGAPSDGSVWEGGDASSRVLRGGSWVNNANYCRAALRNGYTPVNRHDYVGFRVVLVVRTR